MGIDTSVGYTTSVVNQPINGNQSFNRSNRQRINQQVGIRPSDSDQHGQYGKQKKHL